MRDLVSANGTVLQEIMYDLDTVFGVRDGIPTLKEPA